MTTTTNRSLFSQLIVILITAAILTGQATIVFAAPSSGSVAGEITVTGPASGGEKPFVLVNGEAAFSGRTLFPDGTITTTEASSASIDFGKVGRVHLGPASTLTLDVSEKTISGTLSRGTIRVSNSAGVTVKIYTPDDAVTNEQNNASRFTVAVADGRSVVGAEKGVIRYNKGQSTAGRQGDDDNNLGGYWLPVIVIGGAIGALLIYTAVKDDDDDQIVSPVQ